MGERLAAEIWLAERAGDADRKRVADTEVADRQRLRRHLQGQGRDLRGQVVGHHHRPDDRPFAQPALAVVPAVCRIVGLLDDPARAADGFNPVQGDVEVGGIVLLFAAHGSEQADVGERRPVHERHLDVDVDADPAGGGLFEADAHGGLGSGVDTGRIGVTAIGRRNVGGIAATVGADEVGDAETAADGQENHHQDVFQHRLAPVLRPVRRQQTSLCALRVAWRRTRPRRRPDQP